MGETVDILVVGKSVNLSHLACSSKCTAQLAPTAQENDREVYHR